MIQPQSSKRERTKNQEMGVQSSGIAEQGSRFPVLKPNAAGSDIGASSHWVSVPPERDEQSVREFGCYTPDLQALVVWMKQCKVDTVAMESTGVYWIALYELLESEGFEVLLVNAQHLKYVPGRKSDVSDCQWLRQLLSYGLLQASFRPAEAICVLRSYIRQRGTLITDAARHLQRIQKALTQMNLQLHQVLSDISGLSGMRILKSIVNGERDPHKLAALKHERVKKSEAEIAAALSGNYRHGTQVSSHLLPSLEYPTELPRCRSQLL
jgi:transposase